MKNFRVFLMAVMLAVIFPMLGGCVVVIHDTAANRVRIRPDIPTVQVVSSYCGSCLGHRCGYEVYRSHYRTAVVEQTTYWSSTHSRQTRTYSTRPVPVAPRRIYYERSYQPAPQWQARRTTYQSPSTRRRNRASVQRAPSRDTTSRFSQEREEGRQRTTNRTKRRR